MYEKLLIARLINTNNSKLVSSPIMDLIIPIIYRKYELVKMYTLSES